MPDRGFKVQGLGEIAIRCANLESMRHFYEHVIGLEKLEGGHRENICFFRISEGVSGHTTVLALFQCDPNPSGGSASVSTGPASSLHHLALSLPREEQDAVTKWYDVNDIAWRCEEFPWIGWRGIFANDPEGNTIEIVAYDPNLIT